MYADASELKRNLIAIFKQSVIFIKMVQIYCGILHHTWGWGDCPFSSHVYSHLSHGRINKDPDNFMGEERLCGIPVIVP